MTDKVRPLTPERRMEFMQQLGDVLLYMHRPFDWRVFHVDVTIIEDEDELVPEGQANNPFAVCDDHWRQLTEHRPLIQSAKMSARVRWNGSGWKIVRQLQPIKKSMNLTTVQQLLHT